MKTNLSECYYQQIKGYLTAVFWQLSAVHSNSRLRYWGTIRSCLCQTIDKIQNPLSPEHGMQRILVNIGNKKYFTNWTVWTIQSNRYQIVWHNLKTWNFYYLVQLNSIRMGQVMKLRIKNQSHFIYFWIFKSNNVLF